MIDKIKSFWANTSPDDVQYRLDRAIAPGFDMLFRDKGEYSVGPVLECLTHEQPKYRNANMLIYELPLYFFRQLFEYNGINVFNENDVTVDGTNVVLAPNARPKAALLRRWVYPYRLRAFITLPDKVQITLANNPNVNIL